MKHFVGLDVSQDLTHICIVDSDGKTKWQGKCKSTPEEIAETVKARGLDIERIGLETGPLSNWHWRELTNMDLPVVCMDARHVNGILKLRKINKTDKNDAQGLAQIVRTGFYQEVSIKSPDSHTVRAMLGVRSQVVGMRVKTTNQIRGILKNFGIVLKKGSGKSFKERVIAISEGPGLLNETLRALLAVMESLEVQIEVLDRKAHNFAKGNKTCRTLMTIPGVGAITATAFVTSVEDPARFKRSLDVGAYFGLSPKRYQSGERDVNTRISRWGDGLVRSYLYEAANALLLRGEQWSSLKAWGIRIAKRSGINKAKVAVARKLAVIMHRMWVDGTEFRWSNSGEKVVPT